MEGKGIDWVMEASPSLFTKSYSIRSAEIEFSTL